MFWTRNLKVPNLIRGALLEISALTPTYGTAMGYLAIPQILIRQLLIILGLSLKKNKTRILLLTQCN